jgi:tryptophan synthase beta subunit
MDLARQMPRDAVLVINCSGRGDKDCMEAARLMNLRQGAQKKAQ